MAQAQPVNSEKPVALIVSPERRMRRELFDLLDRNGYRVALSASSVGQARDCLSRDPGVGVVLLDLAGDYDEIATFCSELFNSGNKMPKRIIGILASESTPDEQRWLDVKGLNDVIRLPLSDMEAQFRLRGGPPSKGTDLSERAGSDAQGSAASLLELFPDPLLLLEPGSMTISAVNQAFLSMVDQEAGYYLGRQFFELDASHDNEQKAELMAALKRDGALKFQARLPGRQAAGHVVETTLQLGVVEGSPHYLAILRDLGAVQRLQQALNIVSRSFNVQLDDENLGLLLQQCAEWLELDCLYLACQSGRGGALAIKTQFESDRMRETFDAESGGNVLHGLLDGVEALIREAAWRQADQRESFLRHNRLESFVGFPLHDSGHEVIGLLVAGSVTRIRSWKLAVATLRILAKRFALEVETRRFQADPRTQGLYDPLTLLPNRLLFEDRLRIALSEAKRAGEMFAVAFVDIDRFRAINDSHGHDVGDKVLRGVARRLGSAIRASDTVSRYAGDEFVVILRHLVQKDDIRRIAGKLNHILARPLEVGQGKEVELTVSIGISFYPDDGLTVDELIRHADHAVYTAKGLGRNTFQTYVKESQESRQQKLILESKLRNAERNREFRVHYQPQVCAVSEDIIGVEALIRWEHPDLGLISPGFFIPIAEETGLIVSIGEWLLKEACRQVRDWQQRFDVRLRLGVNMSALQLKQPDIIETVSRVLKETDFDPRLLDLEVTESISMKNVPDLLEVLEKFRGLGCGISIDDFGTGQSSLDYIKRFPADRIKIDQTFVRNIGLDPDDAAIVEATINMAHNLNRSVVAEGVEEEQQMEFLQRHGCEELQGYLFARPLSAESFENLLKERERILVEWESAEA